MTAALARPLAAMEVPSFPYAAWQKIVSHVRMFGPDIVVLVARKMPRLAEYLGFNLGANCVTISDMAIPFTHQLIAGARVAVLDDVVNVGSTINRAVRSLRACGATDIRVFALGARDLGYCRSEGVECVLDESFSSACYLEWTETVPTVIRNLPKPYDIEFPIIKCRLNPPYHSADHVQKWLIKRFGYERFHSCPLSRHSVGPARFSIDIPTSATGHSKLRFYLDKDLTCNLVPFEIPAVLGTATSYEPVHPICRALLSVVKRRFRGAPRDSSPWVEEPLIRAEMFIRSLDLGLRYLDELSDLLTINSEPPVSLLDAELLFGPITVAQLSSITPVGDSPSSQIRNESESDTSRTPFFDFLRSKEVGAAFLERIRMGVGPAGGFTLFSVLFDELARAVGASDPFAYSLEWPYSKREILEDPYLRLRIGLTFEDLVCIYKTVIDQKTIATEVQIRGQISALLDHAIDEGTVVPTLARYGQTFYRVFRKGENESRDRAIERALYAWESYNRPLSLTRFTKINAILSFSDEIPQTFSPDLFTRGNVATLEPGVLDLEPAELAHYLLQTGRIMRQENG